MADLLEISLLPPTTVHSVAACRHVCAAAARARTAACNYQPLRPFLPCCMQGSCCTRRTGGREEDDVDVCVCVCAAQSCSCSCLSCCNNFHSFTGWPGHNLCNSAWLGCGSGAGFLVRGAISAVASLQHTSTGWQAPGQLTAPAGDVVGGGKRGRKRGKKGHTNASFVSRKVWQGVPPAGR